MEERMLWIVDGVISVVPSYCQRWNSCLAMPTSNVDHIARASVLFRPLFS